MSGAVGAEAQPPALTAIVPAGDGPSTLGLCRRAIEQADDPPDEVLVVTGPDRENPAALRNAGASRATGEILVFVDADVEVHRDAFTRIRAAFAGDPGLVALFGSYDDRPAAPGLVSAFRNLLHHHIHQTSAGGASTFWAGLGAIRRDAFLAAGGFDSRLYPRPSVEDIELGMRLAALGSRIRLDPHLLGTHHKRWTVYSMARSDLLDRGLPWALALLRLGGPSRALNLGWRHRISALASVSGLIALAARRPANAAAAALALMTLNRPLYVLLWRRLGARGVAGGVVLHALHHTAATIAAGAAGVVCALERGSSSG